MNACLGEDALLRFLNGDLDGDEAAWMVAHIEACRECQGRLERLTRGLLAPGGESTLEMGDHDPGPDGESTTESDETRDFAGVESTEEGVRTGVTVDCDDGRTATGGQDVHLPGPDHRTEASPHWPIVPGYDILQRLGEGGMGVVYKARHLGLNRLVALKMIRGGSQARADFFTRFRVEAESVARLRHPHIIQIYDIGEAEGLPFVALELLDGGSLDARLAGDPQPGRQAAELMIILARAVQVAHEAGIIHRDLKPANVLYTADGVPRITDFGLAKRVDSDGGQTQSGQIMGSPSYMAPEQARGDSRKVGPAADIYALGAILYEMLTGRPPFKGATPIETVRQVVDDDPVSPSRLVPRVPRDLETICLKSLHKDPARRYGSAQALADDLRRYLDGEPIEARRTPFWERGAKWARRRPATAISVAAVLVALLGTVGGLFAYQESLVHRGRTLLALLDQGYGLERRADAARSPDAWRKAQLEISGFLPRLAAVADDPRVKDLRGRLEERSVALATHLEQDQVEQARHRRLFAERGRFDEFRQGYNRAILQLTRFTGLDLPGNEEATRRGLVEALAVYATPSGGGSWALDPLPDSLNPAERSEVAEDCYELLLELSQAETAPDRGLRRLQQADRLHPAPTRAYHLRLASCLERAGDHRAADRERREAESLGVTTAFDHYLAGRERYKRNEPIAAIRHLNHTLREKPDHFWAQCLSAICWLQLKRPDAALAGFNACLKREPEFAWLYILRGFASGMAPAGASPEELAIHSDAAEEDYRRAMERLERRPNAELLYALRVNRGVLRSGRGDWKAAAEDLKAAIELGDHRALASTALADAYLKQGRYDDAFDQFTRAIEHQPNEPALYRARADAVLASRSPTKARRAQALSDLDRTIGLERPGNPVLARDHTNRGRLLMAEGRDAEALAACEAAIQRDRDYPDAHLLRLELLRRMRRHDDVIRSCDPLIARGKATAAIYERRALAREAIRDFSGAIEDFTAAMGLRGDRARLLRLRGWAYIVADAPGLARHDFDEAIRLDPSSGDALNGRGHARLRLGEHSAAVADADKAISLGEPTADLYYKAARVYALAAVVVSAQARKKGQESVLLVARYQDRGVMLLREALRRMPAERRAWFLRESIQSDPALRALRRRMSSLDLAGAGPAAAG